MPRRQRLTFLAVAAVIAVVAIVLITRGDATTDTAATPTATPSRGEAQAKSRKTATPAPRPAVKTLEAGRIQRITATQGDRVTFKVKAAKADEVHLHGYDIKKDAAAGQTITFSVKADITGVFEIEFEAQGEQIGSLVVEPK